MDPVYLRALELSDLDRTYKWHNDADLYETLGSPYRFVSHASEEEWLRKKQAYSPQEVSLAVCLTENSQHIGNIYLRNIDWVARNAELAIFFGETDQRLKGYGTIAARLLIKHAFQDLGLVRLYAFVIEDNGPTIRVSEKAGWTIEGKLRKHAFKDGKFKDVVVLGFCAGDLPSEGD